MNIHRVLIGLGSFLIFLFVVFLISLREDTREYDSASPDISKTWPTPPNNSRIENDEIRYLAKYLPKNVSKCQGKGFMCANNPLMYVGTNARCDGKADCLDGSDEIGCLECQTSFSCSFSKSLYSLVCLRSHNLCDGISQCFDHSDEAICQNRCTYDKYKCRRSSKCLPKRFLCDGEQHCPEGDDEKNCDGKCDNGSRWCSSSNTCLPKWKLCDGIKDCKNGADEADCDCEKCSGQGKMLCRSSNSGERAVCFPGYRVCDGNSDCPNGEDETGCPEELKQTGADMIECKDGKLHSKIYASFSLIPACYGISVDKCGPKSVRDCNNKNCTFKCKSGDKCIFLTGRCDGRFDCDDKSDEENCSAELCAIHPFSMYLCSDKKHCFRKSEVCSPYSNCPNASAADMGYCLHLNMDFKAGVQLI